MPIPQQLDFSKILPGAEARINESWDDWKSGVLLSEEPMINRLMSHFRRIPAACNIGSAAPVTPTFDHALLHRQGTGNKDEYGSDLALTVRVPQPSWIKTAVFQTKISTDYEVTLEKKQLEEARKEPLARPNCFVLAVEKNKTDYRIQTVDYLWGQFPQNPNQKKHKYDATNWWTFDKWLKDWFDGTVGKPSTPNAPKTLEKLLKPYLATETASFDVDDWSQEAWFSDGEFEPHTFDTMTPLAWMIFTLKVGGGGAPLPGGVDPSIKIKHPRGYSGKIV